VNIVEGVVGGSVGGLAVLLLCVVGFIASIATNVEFRRASGSFFCRPGSRVDCLRVYAMPQAWVLGFHLSQLAPLYYGLVLLLAVLAIVFKLTPALKLLAFLSLECSILAPYMIYLMIRYAGAVCVYCLTMHAVSILVTLLTYRAIVGALT
jgi:uncharacterized membrane protein